MSHPPADSSSITAPLTVDATVLAHGGLTWERELRGLRFARLTEVALSEQPTVQVRLQFGLFNQQPVVSGVIKSELQLRCQRCLQTMRYPVEEQFHLLLLDDETASVHVPDTYEVWTAKPTHLDVLALVEEQLLLALPLIAKHSDERDCAVQVVVSEPEKQAPQAAIEQRVAAQKPFGNLRELMRK